MVVDKKVERTDGRGILAGDYLNQNRSLTRDRKSTRLTPVTA